MAILNLCQSFWEKLLEKIWNGHFWPFQICTSLFGKNCQKKFGMAIFGHSDFVPVFLGKKCWKKFRLAIFGHSKFCQPFWKNCWKKLETAIFGHSQFVSVFLGNIVGKNLEQQFLSVLNLYQLLSTEINLKRCIVKIFPKS